MATEIKITDTAAGRSGYTPLKAEIVKAGKPNIELGTAMDGLVSTYPFGADFTVGTEASNTINVKIQLNDAYGDDMAVSPQSVQAALEPPARQTQGRLLRSLLREQFIELGLEPLDVFLARLGHSRSHSVLLPLRFPERLAKSACVKPGIN